MLTILVAAGLALSLRAADATPALGSASATRIAKVETDLCQSLCPAIPAEATSDWLRSPEGRRVNACPMTCRLDQPAAALFRKACELASARTQDADSPLIAAHSKESSDLVRRLRAATKEAEGKKLGQLCARARASLTPSDEAQYLECSGRVVRADAPDALTPPEAGKALRCAALFAERELEWLTRCPALEEQTVLDACDQGSEGARSRRKHPAGARERCENEAVARLASALRPTSRRSAP